MLSSVLNRKTFLESILVYNLYKFRISDVDAWIEVKAITTPFRSNVFMLQIDHQNHVIFPALDFASKEYGLFMRVYFFEHEFEYTIFCTEIRTNTLAITNDFATWCVTVNQDSTTFAVTSQLFDGTYIEEHAISFTHVKSGWQYIRFGIRNNGANLYHDFFVGKNGENSSLNILLVSKICVLPFETNLKLGISSNFF